MTTKNITRSALGALALAAALSSLPTQAKLPAPSDEAKAKATETAAKTAWSGKVEGYKLCLTMDRVAAGYFAAAKKAGTAASAPIETPACADPGPFVYTPPVAAAAPATAQAAAPAPAAAPAAVATK